MSGRAVAAILGVAVLLAVGYLGASRVDAGGDWPTLDGSGTPGEHFDENPSPLGGTGGCGPDGVWHNPSTGATWEACGNGGWCHWGVSDSFGNGLGGGECQDGVPRENCNAAHQVFPLMCPPDPFMDPEPLDHDDWSPELIPPSIDDWGDIFPVPPAPSGLGASLQTPPAAAPHASPAGAAGFWSSQ
jgi:hypothetical protein